jgi:hypothetical protein
MKTLIVTAVFAGLVTGSAFGQQPSAGETAGTMNATLITGANAEFNVEAELTKGLDAKKAKVGDPVMAKCIKEAVGNRGLRIPKNAKLIGHVTEVQARGKGQAQSKLAIAFDKAQMKDGREIPVQAVIQAVAAPPSMAMESDDSVPSSDSMSPPAGVARSGGGALAGVNSTVNSATSKTAATAGNISGNAASAAGNLGSQVGAATTGSNGAAVNSSLGASSSGVIGLKGLQLDTAAASATQASVIRSSSDNVRLESGTRLVLRLTAQ